MSRYTYIENPDKLKQGIKDIIRDIHDEANPHEMNEYKRFFKKNVSIFSRAYFTAWLVKQLAEESADGSSRRPKERPGKNRRKPDRDSANTTSVPTEKRPESDDSQDTGEPTSGDQQTLFVSIGKNRRVFPKDFIALLTELEGVQGEQIGQIKILDSYSFVEVDSDVADQVIEAYNGFEFRGRKLTVNYARSKKN